MLNLGPYASRFLDRLRYLLIYLYCKEYGGYRDDDIITIFKDYLDYWERAILGYRGMLLLNSGLKYGLIKFKGKHTDFHDLKELISSTRENFTELKQRINKDIRKIAWIYQRIAFQERAKDILFEFIKFMSRNVHGNDFKKTIISLPPVLTTIERLGLLHALLDNKEVSLLEYIKRILRLNANEYNESKLFVDIFNSEAYSRANARIRRQWLLDLFLIDPYSPFIPVVEKRIDNKIVEYNAIVLIKNMKWEDKLQGIFIYYHKNGKKSYKLPYSLVLDSVLLELNYNEFNKYFEECIVPILKKLNIIKDKDIDEVYRNLFNNLVRKKISDYGYILAVPQVSVDQALRNSTIYQIRNQRKAKIGLSSIFI